MIILTGNNLGERHRELNMKVVEAADSKTNFDEVKSQEEESDVDKLFKIDVASRYKNIDYILETLKCGDVFHITRALKCLWLYNDEYSEYINSSYLTNNIFPHMSKKMQRKMLTAISIELRNGERAVDFYTYCKESKLKEYAHKFLILTPDQFKIDLIRSDCHFDHKARQKFLQQFIGNSLEVANTYLSVRGYSTYFVHILRIFYSVSDEWYLDAIEKYEKIETGNPGCILRLGLRISKDILKRHKSRIIEYPLLYLNKLNMNMLMKHLTKEDVLSLTPKLLPESAEYFWSNNFYQSYKFILDKISGTERFLFLKEMYNSKYGGESFELRIEFYKLEYYELLSVEEREAWALVHIERDEDLPGIENYIWYKFVRFNKAFTAIKRYIHITPDEDKRSRIVNILPGTGRNQEDVKAILEYYYQRHVNESETNKESFINKVIEHHDIYSFNRECWTPLDQLFYSLEVYTSYAREEYKARAMIYYVLHNMELPEALKEYINNVYLYSISSIINQLTNERNEIVAKYLINHFSEKLKPLLENISNFEVKDDDEHALSKIEEEIDDIIRKIWNVIYCFNRDNNECPEMVIQYMESRKDYYQYHKMYKPIFIIKTEEDFVRWLKKDLETAIEGIYEIRCNTYRWIFRLTRLFRKLKVYFLHDIGKKYLEYFIEYLSNIPERSREYRNIKMAVVGIFYLGDEKFKTDFLEKYVPVTPKIDHINIDNRLLQVQKAICRLAYHSRPPLPLNIIHKYLKGDYVHYFLPIFNNYHVNLPSVQKFIEALLDTPLSIQKHGLRLAFKNYSPDILKPIIIDAWNKTENVSLRKLLFEILFHRIINENKAAQRELYEVLKLFTTLLNHDDHDSVYALLVSNDLPDEFKGDFIETAWLTVSELPEKTVNLYRRINIINHMEKNIHLVHREFPRVQIIDGHLHRVFYVRKFKRYSSSILDDPVKAKWSLTAKYIVSFRNNEEHQQSLELMSQIMEKTFDLWNRVYGETYVSRKFLRKFISIIMSKDAKNSKQCADMETIYQCMLDAITKKLKIVEIYLLTWELKLSIACRKIIHGALNNSNNEQMASEKIISTFGKEVASMVKSLVDNGKFYRSFYQSIAEILNEMGNTFSDIISCSNYGYIYNVAECLTDMKMTETYLLALFMLPKDPYNSWESEHSSVLGKIKEFDDKEVRRYIHNKYVLSDYCVRHYI